MGGEDDVRTSDYVKGKELTLYPSQDFHLLWTNSIGIGLCVYSRKGMKNWRSVSSNHCYALAALKLS